MPIRCKPRQLSGVLTSDQFSYMIDSDKPEIAGTKQEGRDDKGRFVPGVSGNPNGKPLGTKSYATRIMEALGEETFIKTVREAIESGDKKLLEVLWNYVDGKPRQSMEVKEEKTTHNIISIVMDGGGNGRDAHNQGQEVPKRFSIV